MSELVQPEDQWPRDPYWGNDTLGRFQYVDYDEERLIVRRTDSGDLWVDKQGEGPVYVRKQDIPVIIAALQGDLDESQETTE